MIDTDAGRAGVVTGVAVSAHGLAVEQAIAALERQAAALASVHARVGRALATAPSTAAHDWRGFAQQFYDSGLAELRTALVTAALAVGDALAETRRAITTLSGRVG